MQGFKSEGQPVSQRHVTSPMTYSTQEAMLQQMGKRYFTLLYATYY